MGAELIRFSEKKINLLAGGKEGSNHGCGVVLGHGRGGCGRRKRRGVRWRRGGEKPSFPHPILTIGSELDVLLAIDFNGVGFLCIIF
jgi:hypothetical protein